jgi:hypothetical protein
MSGPSKYVTAVVAAAMTAGIGASNVVPVPDKVESADKVESRDVGLVVTIFDLDETVGPLRVIRKLAIEAGTNPLFATIIQEGGNTWDLPGLNTAFDSTSTQHVQADRVPGEYIDFGWDSDQGQIGGWDVLGIVGGSYDVDNHSDLHFRPLLGGSEGIGAALYGTLSDADYDRQLRFFNSGLDLVGDRTIGDFNGELALMPFDGFKAVGGGTLIDTNSDNTFKLGSLTGAAGGTGTLDGRAGLCLGSAQGTPSCGGNTAFLEVGAPVTGDLTLGSTNIISGDFSTNRVVAELGQGQFSVTGAVGGTFTIGSISIGQPIPIDIQIPNNSAVTSLSNERQTQTVRESFRAVPRKLASDNEAGGRHRAPLREAVNATIDNVKTAVTNAVGPKHARPEAED